MNTPKPNVKEYNNILKRPLTAKYGYPKDAGASAGWNRKTESTTWLSSGVSIFLSEEFIGNRTILKLFYRKEAIDAIDIGNL